MRMLVRKGNRFELIQARTGREMKLEIREEFRAYTS